LNLKFFLLLPYVFIDAKLLPPKNEQVLVNQTLTNFATQVIKNIYFKSAENNLQEKTSTLQICKLTIAFLTIPTALGALIEAKEQGRQIPILSFNTAN
jgi:hypothetical protein